MTTRLTAALAAALLLAAPAALHGETAPPKKERNSGFGAFGSSGKEPIKIDADRLDVFDHENKAIFAGNVVAVQGESTIRCSSMTVHYQRNRDKDAKDGAKSADKPADGKAPDAKTSDAKPADPTDSGAIKQVVCAGPVTVVNKDQVATGDNAVFDKAANRVILTGNVVLSQCQNVTRGNRLVYDMNTGRANMDPTAGGRVSAMFVPGGKDEAKQGKQAGCPQPPAQAGKPAPKPRAQAN
ncbi:LptA/OstA family protein [Methylobacterium nodulans]|uniref:OstA family protein n=1 Tax=Methylobacterium nodulans (strain LMG 21967 / CNCM I-2342 / ORS 2060) TaxID=460265 RepID=B8ISV3_METNO|nr:LptA/OstA family protein [Methylobacterium nodulans]ACL60752.1 OstA family protein [Methylobacterium nodulans ORS 2060]